MIQRRSVRRPDTARLARVGRETALTAGAVLGVLCMTLAAVGLAFDVRPVIFRSGSMEPTIQTGALALSRTVDASELAVGDVVTVRDSEGTRVTHRVRSLSHSGADTTLVLQGDANAVADAEPYVVQSVERVLVHVPRLGYVVSTLSGPVGIFGAGLLVGLVLTTAFGRGRREDERDDERHEDDGSTAPPPEVDDRAGDRDDEGTEDQVVTPRPRVAEGRRGALLTAVVAITAIMAAGSVATTSATWVDDAAVTTGSFTMQEAPAQPITCTVVPIGNGYGIRLDWVSAQNPFGGWTIDSNSFFNDLALGVPILPLGANTRQWTSLEFNNRSGTVTVGRVIGPNVGSVSFNFGPGNGIGNKSCSVNP